ncbi:MAG: FAD:protein FMN transferase [Gammaproteobacteria bacterium]|jgi:thiamine biosynthesis lipoprotein|nr:FAD:protein FMN transferase [Gammaproteobacteria bacterium]
MHKTISTLINKHLSTYAVAIILFASAIFISACNPPIKQYDYSIFAFGTLIDISLYDTDQRQADEAFGLLQQLFDKNHNDWSPWTNGDLALLNQKLSVQATASVPEHLIPIIKTSIDLSQRSKNYYNPAIGHLINLWQFHKYQDADIRPPDDDKIQELISKKPQMSDLTFDSKDQLINTNPAVSLNFGAFAKGYAIKLAMEHLHKLDIHNAVINAGGDLSVIGQHGERAWNIGIRHPRKNSLLASIEVNNNESVFTSGDYERFYTYQSKRYHHILDPETGYPTDDTQSVTVIHSDAGYADAAATALFVAGSQEWQTIANNMNLQYVMLIAANGDIHLTSAMEKRLKFLNKPPTSRIIVYQEL